MTADSQPSAAASDEDSPGHFSRHMIGYATVIGVMAASIAERLEAPGAITPRDVVLIALGALISGCAAITAYRAVPIGSRPNSAPPAP